MWSKFVSYLILSQHIQDTELITVIISHRYVDLCVCNLPALFLGRNVTVSLNLTGWLQSSKFRSQALWMVQIVTSPQKNQWIIIFKNVKGDQKSSCKNMSQIKGLSLQSFVISCHTQRMCHK